MDKHIILVLLFIIGVATLIIGFLFTAPIWIILLIALYGLYRWLNT